MIIWVLFNQKCVFKADTIKINHGKVFKVKKMYHQVKIASIKEPTPNPTGCTTLGNRQEALTGGKQKLFHPHPLSDDMEEHPFTLKKNTMYTDGAMVVRNSKSLRKTFTWYIISLFPAITNKSGR